MMDSIFERADAYLHLSNDPVSSIAIGKVSESMMYRCIEVLDHVVSVIPNATFVFQRS